jgi:predicted small lipoprotein YifL
MKSLFHISMISLALAACGSDGPNFGPEKDPTPAEQSTINSTAQNLQLIAQADVEGQETAGAALAFAFNAQSLLDDGTAVRTVPGLRDVARLVPDLVPALLSPGAAPFDDCAVVGTNSVVWNHCQDSSGYVIDGMISWSPGHVDVDLHISGTSSGYELTYSFVGSITVSSSAIDGDMTVSLSYTGGGTSASETIRTQIDVQIANNCVSSGTLTVTASGSGAGSRNAAVQVVWTGCNMFRVRRA